MVVAPVAAAPNHNRYIRRRLISAGVAVLGILTHADILTGLGIGGGVMNEIIHRDEVEGPHSP